MAERGRRASVVDLFAQAPLAFLRNYLLKGGIKDGRVGLVISLMNSYYVLLKYVKLWELRRTALIDAPRRRRGVDGWPACAEIRCCPCTSTRPGPGAAARIRRC